MLDIAVLVVTVLFAIGGAKKGFIKSLVDFLGAVVAMAIAGILSLPAAQWVYNTFLRDALTEKVAATVTGMNAADSVEAVFAEFPELVLRALEAVGITEQTVLTQLAVLLTNVEDEGGPMAGCPFAATLTLMLADGQRVEMQLATDSCCVYRVDGRDYAYARHLFDPNEGAPENVVLFGLFGLDASSTWAK